MGKDTEHILDKLANLVGLALGLFVDVLQVGNHGHDLVHASLQDGLLFLEVVDQGSDIIHGAFALGALGGTLENGVGLGVAQNDETGRRGDSGL